MFTTHLVSGKCRRVSVAMTMQTALLGVFLLFANSSQPDAAQLEDWQIPDAAQSADRELSLFSCALRELLWTEVYSVAFYLPGGRRQSSAMWDPAVAKLIRVEIVYDGTIPVGLPQEWRAQLKQVLDREALVTFRNLYNDLTTGDVLEIVYDGQRATQVALNGQTEATLEGHEFIEALLALWIGQEPVSKNLRRLLLSHGC